MITSSNNDFILTSRLLRLVYHKCTDIIVERKGDKFFSRFRSRQYQGVVIGHCVLQHEQEVGNEPC